MLKRDPKNPRLLASAAVLGLLAGCGGGGAERAADMRAAPFSEPGVVGSSAEPAGSSAPKMNCTAEMMGTKR